MSLESIKIVEYFKNLQFFLQFQTFIHTGHIKTSTLNNLNLNNDIVRWSRPRDNIVRADKSFGSVSIEQLYCQFRCSVQGVDVTKWIATSALNSFDYVIRGRVHLNNAIASHIQVDGLVNGQRLTSKSILLKHTPQRIDGSVTVGNSRTDNELMPLTFDNIQVNWVNNQNFSGFRENIVERSRHNRIFANIFTDLHFGQTLIIEHLNNLVLQNSSIRTNPVQQLHHLFRTADEVEENEQESRDD